MSALILASPLGPTWLLVIAGSLGFVAGVCVMRWRVRYWRKAHECTCARRDFLATQLAEIERPAGRLGQASIPPPVPRPHA